MLEKETSLTQVKGQTTCLLVIPADIAKDSQFPFKVPSKVIIRIEGDKLIVEKGKVKKGE